MTYSIYKDRKKQRIYSSIRKAILDSIGMVILFSFIIYVMFILGNIFLPQSAMSLFYNKFVYLILGVFILYQGVNKYLGSRRFGDLLDAIFEIKGSPDALLELEHLKNLYNMDKSIIEKKLDFVKSFFPMPMLIYGLGIYVDDKSILVKSTNLFGIYNLQIRDGLYIVALIGFASYLYYLYVLFKKYRFSYYISIWIENDINNIKNKF